MCRANSEGGRRCPIHRHDTRIIIETLRQSTPGANGSVGGLPTKVYERFFSNARRLYRGSNDSSVLGKYENSVQSRLQEMHARGEIKYSEDTAPADIPTMCAQIDLMSAAEHPSVLQEIHSAVQEYGPDDAKAGLATFNYAYSNPDEFTDPPEEDMRMMREKVPSEDPHVIRGLALLNSPELYKGNPQVFSPPQKRIENLADISGDGSPLAWGGYSPESGENGESRVELRLNDDTNTYVTYRNVTASQWERLTSGGAEAGKALREIRATPDCRYRTVAEADRASFPCSSESMPTRCPSCGQFISRVGSHACRRVLKPTVLEKIKEWHAQEGESFVLEDQVPWRLPSGLENDVRVREEGGHRTLVVLSPPEEGISGDRLILQEALASDDFSEQVVGALQINDVRAPPASILARSAQAMDAGDSLSFAISFDVDHDRDVFTEESNGGTMSNYNRKMILDYSDERQYRVEGDVEFEKDDDGTIYVSGTSLKCDCPVYRRNYDCVHVQRGRRSVISLLEEDPGAVPGSPNSGNEPRSAYMNALAIQVRETNLGWDLTLDQARELADEELDDPDGRDLRYDMRERRYMVLQEERERQLRHASLEARRKEFEPYEKHRQRMEAREFEGARYSESPESFDLVVDDARQAFSSGQEVFEYETVNVLGGIADADDPGARGFGVEIEFDLDPSVDSHKALKDIGQELYEAGLTSSKWQNRYGTGAMNGWETWSFEHDNSVNGGELVTPVLKDTPEDWEKLRQACEIIKKHGGRATTNSGSHVNISTASYGQSVAAHVGIVDMVSRNEDLMYRLSSNPYATGHRTSVKGTWDYCSPNILPKEGHRSSHDVLDAEVESAPYIKKMRDALGFGTNRENMVNIERSGSDEYKTNRVEFRMFDATLEPAIIQQQVKLAAAMTQTVDSEVSQEGGFTPPKTPKQPMGQNHSRPRMGNADSMGVRALADRLFPREKDREGLAKLFTITRWQKGI